jgi:hypothetical protein
MEYSQDTDGIQCYAAAALRTMLIAQTGPLLTLCVYEQVLVRLADKQL